MSVKTFWVERLPKHEWRYTAKADGPCSVHGAHHLAESPAVVIEEGREPPGFESCPDVCACGHSFRPSDKTGHGEPFWHRLHSGGEIKGSLPPGALYVDAPMRRGDGWEYKGADGLNVVCVLPNGHHWWIDSRASNCTMKDDVMHRCWVRHGTVGGVIHVDKNGNTCRAGAGSIMSGDYHGFLHNGVLT